MDRFTVALAFALIAVVLALLMLATKVGDKPEYIIDSAAGTERQQTAIFQPFGPIPRPRCPKLANPCAAVNCHRRHMT